MATGVKVSEIMTKAVITAKEDDSIYKAAKIMKKADIGGLVVAKKGKVVGIITEGDIIKDVLAEGLDYKKVSVRMIMKHPVRTIPPETDVEEAARIMRDLNIERLPVVNKEGNLIGIVTERDLTLIEPALLEIMKEKEAIPTLKEEVAYEGICENCGNYSENLRYKNGMYVCEDCYYSE